jgi:RimJ/RimL family protein N-acetyltransferase
VAASNEDPTAYRWNVVPTDEPAMEDYVRAALDDQAAGTALPFATVRLPEAVVVGSTRFLRMERWPWPPDNPCAHADGHPDVVEIGATWLAVSAQRTAVNTEAKLLMLGHAFDHWRVHRVSIITDARNEQSRAAIARLGAEFEGIVRAHRIGADGTVRDSARSSILAGDWEAIRTRLQARLDTGGAGLDDRS